MELLEGISLIVLLFNSVNIQVLKVVHAQNGAPHFYLIEINGQAVNCSLCAPGSHRVEHCKPTDPYSTLCKPCQLGTEYMDYWNRAIRCATCSSCTRKDEHIKTICTRTKHTVCECNKEFYLKSKYYSFCSPHFQCGYGFGVSKHGTAESDVECIKCVDGETFSDHISTTDECTNLTRCEDNGLILVQRGNTEQDNVCSNQTYQTAIMTKTTSAKPTTEDLTTEHQEKPAVAASVNPDVTLDKKEPDTKDGNENHSYVYGIVGAIVCIIIIVISVFIYRANFKKRKKVAAELSDCNQDGSSNSDSSAILLEEIHVRDEPSASCSNTELLNDDQSGDKSGDDENTDVTSNCIQASPTQLRSQVGSHSTTMLNESIGVPQERTTPQSSNTSINSQPNKTPGGYKKMLIDMANALGTKDLAGFKFLLADLVGDKHRLREANKIETFRLLEDEELIGEDDTSLVYNVFNCMQLPRLQSMCKKMAMDKNKQKKPNHISVLLYREAKNISKNDISNLVYSFEEKIGDSIIAKEITDNENYILLFDHLRGKRYASDRDFLYALEKAELPIAASVRTFLHQHQSCPQCALNGQNVAEQILTSL